MASVPAAKVSSPPTPPRPAADPNSERLSAATPCTHIGMMVRQYGRAGDPARPHSGLGQGRSGLSDRQMADFQETPSRSIYRP
jgi:hypothetical protein